MHTGPPWSLSCAVHRCSAGRTAAWLDHGRASCSQPYTRHVPRRWVSPRTPSWKTAIVENGDRGKRRSWLTGRTLCAESVGGARKQGSGRTLRVALPAAAQYVGRCQQEHRANFGGSGGTGGMAEADWRLCEAQPVDTRPKTSRLKGDVLWRQDAGATALAEALRSNGALQHLDLHACAIRCLGAAALAQALLAGGGGPLASLNLRANYIGDAGATALAGAVRRSRGLRCLVTSSNDIGRAGQVRRNEIRALIPIPPRTHGMASIPRTHGMASIPIPPTRRPTTSGVQDRCAQKTHNRWHSGKRTFVQHWLRAGRCRRSWTRRWRRTRTCRARPRLASTTASWAKSAPASDPRRLAPCAYLVNVETGHSKLGHGGVLCSTWRRAVQHTRLRE
jgi:hypothetical protein